MKLNREFLLHNANGESILVPTGKADFSGIVRGNTTLGVVLELLKTDITAEQLIVEMQSRFDAEEGVIEKDVQKALSELRRIGALDE